MIPETKPSTPGTAIQTITLLVSASSLNPLTEEKTDKCLMGQG